MSTPRLLQLSPKLPKRHPHAVARYAALNLRPRRRFGKTISVSMFAAAMLYACPNMELSIYSTCKRISQKLLRHIVKFLEIIFLELRTTPYKKIRMNQVHAATQKPSLAHPLAPL